MKTTRLNSMIKRLLAVTLVVGLTLSLSAACFAYSVQSRNGHLDAHGFGAGRVTGHYVNVKLLGDFEWVEVRIPIDFKDNPGVCVTLGNGFDKGMFTIVNETVDHVVYMTPPVEFNTVAWLQLRYGQR